MDIIYKKGDLLQCEENIIVHGCNRQGVMGSGVAKLIKAKYPSAFDIYYEAVKSGEHLGSSSFAAQDDGKLIINALTQEYYGRMEGVVYVDYVAIRAVMKDLNWFAEQVASEDQPHEGYYLAIAMPKIGAGLGGGSWDIIAHIIEEESTSFQPVVYTLD